jgi:hypothetical protein
VLRKILKFPEVFIRSNCAKLIAKNFHLGSPSIIEEVFNDSHPFVVNQGIRGCIKSWGRFSKTLRQGLIIKIEKVLKKRMISILTSDTLVGFYKLNDDYENEPSQWELWAHLLPQVLKILPQNFQITQLYLYQSFTDSSQFLSPTKIDHLINEFCEYSLKIAKTQYIETDLSLFWKKLIERKSVSTEKRVSLLRRLIKLKDTNSILLVIPYYIQNWKLLSIDEKNELLSFVSQNRADIHLVHAVILVQDKVSKSILMMAAKQSELLAEQLKEVHSALSPELLKGALLAFCGIERMYNISRETQNDYFWNSLLGYCTMTPDSPGFEIGLFQLLMIEVYRSRKAPQKPIKIWMRLLEKVTDSKIETLFEYLLLSTVRMTGYEKIKGNYWKCFFSCLDRRNLDHQKFVDRIANVVGHITPRNYISLIQIFGQKKITEEILPKFEVDKILFDLYFGFNFKGGEYTFLPIIRKLYQTSPPSLVATHEETFFQLKKWGIEEKSIFKLVEQKRKEAFSAIRSSTSIKDHFFLKGWIDKLSINPD